MNEQASNDTAKGMRFAIVGSLIFWASSCLQYFVKYRITDIFPNQVANSLAALPLLVMTLIGLLASVIYLLVWPIRFGHHWLRSRAPAVYLSGLVLGFVLFELLRLEQEVAYLQTLGTLTAAGVIALVVDAGVKDH
jgi:hypothetical protein